jgi:hypothetical protein
MWHMRKLATVLALAAVLYAPSATAHSDPYAGIQLQPRAMVGVITQYWPNQKVKALATAIAESHLYVGAWHDNLDTFDALISRDCGVFQINLSRYYVGTPVEDQLRTSSRDPNVYGPVVANNVRAAYRLWASPWVRNGKPDYRRWQAWVAYGTGWAMFGEAWVWHQDNGVPVGPWVATGRYLHQAIRGVANYYIVNSLMTESEALREAERLATQYGAKGELRFSDQKLVYWVFPPKPTAPPADGVGPRPIPNNGV